MALVLGLDNPKEEFSPGQTIAGRVHCLLRESKFLEVKIRLIGEECTYYIERTNSNPFEKFWNRYFLDTKETIGSGNFDEGEYKFSFKQTLPTNIPSTYVGSHGYVKYFIRASIISNCKEVENDKIEIKVFAPINSETLRRMSLLPNTRSEDFVIPRWFCIPQSISMNVKLEKTFLVLGETTNVIVKLANNSSVTVSAISVELYNREVAKVSFREFLPTHKLLAKGQGTGVRPYGNKTFISELKIPEDAEIPNLQLCKFLTHQTILEVKAILENSSKNKVKIDVELILGYPATPKRQERTLKNVQEPTTIRPYTYGFTSDTSTEVSKSGPRGKPTLEVPYPSSRSSISKSSYEKLYDGPNPTPPYPTGFKSDLCFNAEVPVPSRSPPYPPKEGNLPYPPSDCLPYPKEDNQMSPPYPIGTSCPYPTENLAKSQTHSISSNLPSHKEGSKLSDLSRSDGQSCPYPTGNKLEVDLPYPKEDIREYDKGNVPYPKEDNQMSPPYPIGTSCSYPTENWAKSQTHSISSNLPSHKEGSKLSDLSRSGGESCPYPTGNKLEVDLPYPKDDIREYDKGNVPSNSSRTSFEEKHYSFTRKSDEEASLFYKSLTDSPKTYKNISNSASEEDGLLTSKTLCPYPPTERPNFNAANDAEFSPSKFGSAAPETISNASVLPRQMNLKSNNLTEHDVPFSSSKIQPPYPTTEHSTFNAMTEFSPHMFDKTDPADTSVFSGNMPMPLKSTDLIQRDFSHLPSKVQPPYPTAEHSNLNGAEFCSPKFGNTAPYPPENPALHKTVGFADFTPMPMPSDKSSIPSGSMGFAVPMPNLPSSKLPLEPHTQPSAPLLSDLKTPPIAQIEELDLLFIDADKDVSDIEDRELESFHLSPIYQPSIPPRKDKKERKRELLLSD